MRKWIEKMLRLPGPLPDFLSTAEVAEYAASKGLGPYLRGLLIRWRFKSCGSLLFIGKDCRFYFPRFISLGRNVLIGAHCMINGLSKQGMRFGNGVHIREFTWIQATSQLHDPGAGLTIGDDTYIGPYGYLGAGGGLYLGKGVVVGAFVQFLAENHRFEDASVSIREQGVSRKGIRIEDEVWIGNHAILLDGIHVGRGSVVAAGAVVTHDVPANAVVAGNPARIIKERK